MFFHDEKQTEKNLFEQIVLKIVSSVIFLF